MYLQIRIQQVHLTTEILNLRNKSQNFTKQFYNPLYNLDSDELFCKLRIMFKPIFVQVRLIRFTKSSVLPKENVHTCIFIY